MSYVVLKRERCCLKEKLLLRFDTVKGTDYLVQAVEYNLEGDVMEDVHHTYETFAEAHEGFKEGYKWLTLCDRIEKAWGIHRRIHRKIVAYKNANKGHAPEAWIRAIMKIRMWLRKNHPHLDATEFYRYYL
jgi:hypothetical protein